jgi:Fe-S oxidoreductase
MAGRNALMEELRAQLDPRYALASIVSLLQKRYPEARFGILARGCDARALVEMAKREQVDPDRLYLLGVACTAEEAEECHCADPAPDPAPWPQAEVIIRAMHMTGRCVACRQCELTCPAHIPLTVLYDLMRRDVGELLGYVPGADIEAAPPLSLTLEEAPLRVR